MKKHLFLVIVSLLFCYPKGFGSGIFHPVYKSPSDFLIAPTPFSKEEIQLFKANKIYRIIKSYGEEDTQESQVTYDFDTTYRSIVEVFQYLYDSVYRIQEIKTYTLDSNFRCQKVEFSRIDYAYFDEKRLLDFKEYSYYESGAVKTYREARCHIRDTLFEGESSYELRNHTIFRCNPADKGKYNCANTMLARETFTIVIDSNNNLIAAESKTRKYKVERIKTDSTEVITHLYNDSYNNTDLEDLDTNYYMGKTEEWKNGFLVSKTLYCFSNESSCKYIFTYTYGSNGLMQTTLKWFGSLEFEKPRELGIALNQYNEQGLLVKEQYWHNLSEVPYVVTAQYQYFSSKP